MTEAAPHQRKLLPLPFELLALATRYLQGARSLTSTLAKRPAWQYDEKDALEAADLASTQRRYLSAALACLRKVVSLAETGQVQDARVRLRAQAMLAEILVRDTHAGSEVEMLLTKGIAAASKHDSLFHYRCHFSYLQIKMALSANQVKFAKASCRRLIAQVLSSHVPLGTWRYRFLLLYVYICETHEADLIATLAALRETLHIAETQRDALFCWILRLQMMRVAVMNEDDVLASAVLMDLLSTGGFKIPTTNQELDEHEQLHGGSGKTAPLDLFTPSVKSLIIPNPLITHFLVLMAVWQTQTGEIRAAKSTLKRVHALLDEANPTDDGSCTWICVPVNTAHPATTQDIYIETVSRSFFYAYTFLISTIVQLDPVGKEPRCMLYARAGLSALLEKTEGFDKGSLPSFADNNDTLEKMTKIVRPLLDLWMYQTQLLLMRSRFDEAEKIMVDLVSTVRAHNVWTEYAARILLLEGSLCHSQGAWSDALDCYMAAWQQARDQSQISIVCRASILCIQISKTQLSSQANEPSASWADHANNSRETLEQLHGVARDLVTDCRKKASPLVTVIRFVLEALTGREIVRAKACLSSALTVSNETNNQYMKPLILALLSCYFLHTRNEQAVKMLHSAHKICRSMGGKESDEKDGDGNRIISKSIVGLARLGLWTGCQMLEIYNESGDQEKASRQQLYNEAHRDMLHANEA